MKILAVCQYYDPEPFRVCDICEGLAERGHQVTAVTGMPNYPEGILYKDYADNRDRDEMRRGVHVHRCRLIPRKRGVFFRFLNYYSFVLSADRYLRSLREDYDLVFVNQLSPVMMAGPAQRWARKHHKNCLLYCMDLWPESLLAGGVKKGGLIYNFYLRVSRKLYRRADRLAVTSYGFLSYFEEVLKLPAEKITYLPQSAEELFTRIPRSEEKKDGVDFLFAGNIGVLQSVETIVEAARLLQDRKDIRIHIVGGGISLEKCRELGRDLPNLTFYGRRPLEEMTKFYSMADVMLITLVSDPVISKTLPGKFQSYMAAGKPIVGAIDGEAARTLKTARCGDCVASEDAQALARLMARTAEDPGLRRQWGDNARTYYHENFRKELFLDRLEALLEETLRAKEEGTR